MWILIVMVCCAACSLVMFLPHPEDEPRPVRRAPRAETPVRPARPVNAPCEDAVPVFVRDELVPGRESPAPPAA